MLRPETMAFWVVSQGAERQIDEGRIEELARYGDMT